MCVCLFQLYNILNVDYSWKHLATFYLDTTLADSWAEASVMATRPHKTLKKIYGTVKLWLWLNMRWKSVRISINKSKSTLKNKYIVRHICCRVIESCLKLVAVSTVLESMSWRMFNMTLQFVSPTHKSSLKPRSNWHRYLE